MITFITVFIIILIIIIIIITIQIVSEMWIVSDLSCLFLRLLWLEMTWRGIGLRSGGGGYCQVLFQPVLYTSLLLCLCSLESRDNPFLPGGDLSRETEELLKRATIVRDKFYLDQQERKQQLLQANNQSRGGHPVSNKEQTTYSADDGELPSANSGSRSDMDGAMEERISLPSNRAEVGVEFYPRENGKAGDNLDTSPAGIKLDVGGSPTADGHKAANNDNATDQSDRAKRRPKCCVVM